MESILEINVNIFNNLQGSQKDETLHKIFYSTFFACICTRNYLYFVCIFDDFPAYNNLRYIISRLARTRIQFSLLRFFDC